MFPFCKTWRFGKIRAPSLIASESIVIIEKLVVFPIQVAQLLHNFCLLARVQNDNGEVGLVHWAQLYYRYSLTSKDLALVIIA